ncbi:MAG TPA: metallophosphoesterase family protein [Candidatus Limnocylindria bacterium]|nr:metallophosphoesterase family protein [Candidatus Limnocylindria bacterium]
MNYNTTRIVVSVSLCLLVFGICGLRAASTTLLHFGSAWRYHDFGVDPGTNWFKGDFGDGDWSYSFSQFGWGEDDEQTETTPAITTYFRGFVTIAEPLAYSSFTLRLLRDDGAAVYVNGTEVLRNNLSATGLLTYNTLASSGVNIPQETNYVVTNLTTSVFQQGVNLIAVEIHQASVDSSDMSFNLELVGTHSTNAIPTTVLRGPYLQVGTSSNIIVRWRTTSETNTVVHYGTSLGALNQFASNSAPVTEHEIKLTSLLPDTKYFYALGTSTSLVGEAGCHFVTAPAPGMAKPTRIWAIGDFGTGYAAQYNVRDAYTNFTGTRHTDAWLFLGDNAYNSGFDEEYQSYCFNVYSNELKRMVVWPTVGNHETAQIQALSDDFDYYRIFTMPMAGEAGGVPSGTEHYYSYDYANIHFIVLDSMTAIYRDTDSSMAEWLRADLADTTQDWIIAYFHHPPYTKGSHNSDTESELIEMRAQILPILEAGGVDLVLSGHSHCYERSFLIDGFYGHSSTITSSHLVNPGDGRTTGDGAYLKTAGGTNAGGGTVYVVDGSSGGQGGGGNLNHPAMFFSVLTYGSLVIDIDGLRLDATFVTADGTVDDTFTILKGDLPGDPQPTMIITRAGTNVVIRWPVSSPEYSLQSTPVLAPSQWSPVTASASTNGGLKTVTLPVRRTNEFFQLRRDP